MSTRQTLRALHQLRQLADARPGPDLSDGELLERFRAHGEGPAFTILVQRHGPMVLGVCRRLLQDEHDAEDAFQATFLLLVRRALTGAPAAARPPPEPARAGPRTDCHGDPLPPGALAWYGTLRFRHPDSLPLTRNEPEPSRWICFTPDGKEVRAVPLAEIPCRAKAGNGCRNWALEPLPRSPHLEPPPAPARGSLPPPLAPVAEGGDLQLAPLPPHSPEPAADLRRDLLLGGRAEQGHFSLGPAGAVQAGEGLVGRGACRRPSVIPSALVPSSRRSVQPPTEPTPNGRSGQSPPVAPSRQPHWGQPSPGLVPPGRGPAPPSSAEA
jgi:hypothetical protein